MTHRIQTDGSSYQTIDSDPSKARLTKIDMPGYNDIVEVELLESGDIAFRMIYLRAHDVHDHDKGTLKWKFHEEAKMSISICGEAARKLAIWILNKTQEKNNEL